MLTVRNTGTSALTVSALSSTNALFSVLAPAVPFTVTPDATPVTVFVLFTPTFDGAHTGRLNITSDDPDLGTVAIPLQGTGKGGVPNFVGDQVGVLNFGSVCVGDSATRGLRVGNNGTGTLSVHDINLTPSYSVSFPEVPFSVAPHASPVTVNVRFSPTSPGPTPNAGLSIFTNDPDTKVVNQRLFGEGIPRGEPCSGICCETSECGGCLPEKCVSSSQDCK